MLHTIIHPNQTACIPTRTINDNVSLLRDAITYANDTNTPLALISLDQLKAFDRVSHSFLFKTLEKFDFGPQFVKWIQLIYNQISSSVKSNGWLTAFINLERGLRQGCPLSAPLYILTAELMALHIRAHPHIHGLKPPNSADESKLSQFADDTTLLLTDDDSIHHAFTVLNSYERASGAKVNREKCKGLWSGAFRQRTDQLYHFDWYNDYIPEPILGLYFGNTDCTLRNIQPRINKIQNTCNAWANRDLSFKGKALVINGLLTSVLWYRATAITFLPWAVRDIEHIIYNFFWSGKMPLVNRATLSLPSSEGGFNIHRISTKIKALRLSTLRRLLSPEPADWKNFLCYYLRVAGLNLGKLTLTLAYKTRHIDPNIPSFHREAWLTVYPLIIRTSEPETFNDILAEPLFLNPLITNHGESLCYNHWINSGVTHVGDLCYGVIPGFLPSLAIHDLLTDIPFPQAERELATLLSALPDRWKTILASESSTVNRPIQPTFATFAIKAQSPNSPSIPLENVSTKRFHSLLVIDQPISIPALQYWKRTIPPPIYFNSTFWKSLYCPLLPNKYGDVNWKIVYRVLPTAYRLHKMNFSPTMTCHRCTATETLDHLLLHCPALGNFWSKIQTYLNKLTQRSFPLTDYSKLFGLPVTDKDNDRMTKHLVNFILSLARFSIYKSAVEHCIHQKTLPPESIFKSLAISYQVGI